MESNILTPEYLYKYYSVSPHSLESLIKKRIAFIALEKFNDPFEGIESADVLKYNKLKAFFNNALRASCFTTDPFNQLMWSHYGKSHTGFCVKYSYKSINKVSDILKPVTYNEIPHLLKTDFNLSYGSAIEQFDKIFLTKSKIWAYENEWRAVLNVQNLNLDNEIFNDTYIEKVHVSNGFKNVKIPQILLKNVDIEGVFLGIKTSAKDRGLISKCFKSGEIGISEIRLKRGSYDLI